jgi:hypothetical protein
MLSRTSPSQLLPIGRIAKKLALVAIATAINAGLLLLAGPLTSGLPRSPERMLSAILVGVLFVFYIVFAAMLSFAPSSLPQRRSRVLAVLIESLVALVVFTGVLLFLIRRIP